MKKENKKLITEAMGIDIKGMKKDDLIEAIESNETKVQIFPILQLHL